MKKLWLLLVVIALGGCKMNNDNNSEDKTFNLTVINNSDETLAVKFQIWAYNYYEKEVQLDEFFTCIFSKDTYTLENVHYSPKYNNITNFCGGSRITKQVLEEPLHFEKDTTVTLNFDYKKYIPYVESIM